MSYEICAGDTSFNLTWNYNVKIIQPALGGETLRQFNGKTCLEAAEGIASIIEFLNCKLNSAQSSALMKQGMGGDGLPAFMEEFGNGPYGNVVTGILRLTEIMIACYRQPTAIFLID